MDREKVMKNMNIAKAVLCNPNMVTPEMCIMIGQTISDALSLLKEQEPAQGFVDTDGVPHCDSCGWVQSYGCNYCDNCGKRLIWE
jgi:hypothetical protein